MQIVPEPRYEEARFEGIAHSHSHLSFQAFECSSKGFVVIERILLDTNTSNDVYLSNPKFLVERQG